MAGYEGIIITNGYLDIKKCTEFKHPVHILFSVQDIGYTQCATHKRRPGLEWLVLVIPRLGLATVCTANWTL